MSAAPATASAKRIDTVVIPVAGRGTRLLPATKAIRKELLPVGRKPLLLYAVEEALASGAERIIFVTTPNDQSIIRFFGRDLELESYLHMHGRCEEAVALEKLSTSARFAFVSQESPRGLADAILCAREATVGRPFGVILPDALILSERPCIGQLMRSYGVHGGCVIATRAIERHETLNFGVLTFESRNNKAMSDAQRVLSLVEKPRPECAPSLYGIFGRYIFEPGIFDAIQKTCPGEGQEMQLTDAINLYCKNNAVFGYPFEGKHIDTGNWQGYGLAVLECLLADRELKLDPSPRMTSAN
ncbi:MAG: sugar phosphate nucleotidyltransferase [Terracidiphilus sp.]